jgi:hypothetical protein
MARAISSVDLDLVVCDRTKKLLLTKQRPVVHAIVQLAIEHLRASLLFNNAFPNVHVANTLTKAALLTAAVNKPGGDLFRRRLQEDPEYLSKILTLVSHSTPEMTSLMFIDSRVLGYHFFVVKSRIAAVLLAPRHFLPLVHLQKLLAVCRSNCHSTHTRSQMAAV